MKRRIILRADGNAVIGLGHVYRLIALAEMLNKNFEISFFIANPDSFLKNTISQHVSHLIELPASYKYKTTSLKKSDEEIPFDLAKYLTGNEIVVTDGYWFGPNYQQAVKNTGAKLVCIDDEAKIYFYADLIINHGNNQAQQLYKTEPDTKVLSGWQYLLLREPFRNAAKRAREIGKINAAFICMGGADPFNITQKALRAALACNFIKHIIVVTGSAHSSLNELKQIIAGSEKKITHIQNVAADEMVKLITECEIAICPASSVALEICCVKTALLTGTVIDNQSVIHQQLFESGCCISVNDFNKVSVQHIKGYLEKMNNLDVVKTIIRNQAKAIDGLSGERILKAFKELAAC